MKKKSRKKVTVTRKEASSPIGIQIGASEGSIEALSAGILAILDCQQDQETLRAALETLKSGSRVEAVITNCSINMTNAVEAD